MSLIEFDGARRFFEDLPDDLKFAHLSPSYVWADSQREGDLVPTFFLYQEGGDFFCHGFHLSKVSGSDFYDIQSPYGYGGPLVRAGDKAFMARAWESYCDWCREKRILAEFIRFHPVLENYRYYPGKIICDRSTIWVDACPEDPFDGYDSRTRSDVRRALKNGLRVKIDDTENFLSYFKPLYIETMRRIGAAEFYNFDDSYFDAIVQTPVKLLLCLCNDVPVAGAMFLFSGENMEYHLAASTLDGRNLRAGHLLVHQARMLARENGCKYLHLGGGTNSDHDNKLLLFKKGFSKNMASFCIGNHVFFQEEYVRMRQRWEETMETPNNKVLFYR